MNRNSNSYKDLSAHTAGRHPVRSPIARWRNVFSALVLPAIFLGSLSQPSLAQAAPARAKYAYFVFATLPKSYGTICVGDNVPISVRVARTSIDIQTDSMNISGIWVAGSVQDPGIGKLIIARKETGFDYEQPGIAGFIFHAEKPGKTTLFFNAEIRYYQSTILKWIYGPAKIAQSNPVEVTVEVCKYKVSVVSHWEFNGLNYMAIIDQAGMSADAPGHFTGTAQVFWVIRLPPGNPCPSVTTSTSQADLTGVMDADGQHLVVDLAYQLLDTYWNYDIWDNTVSACSTSSETHVLYTPASLTLSLPSYGGVSTQSQALVNQIYAALNMTGSAKVAVLPVAGH